MNVTRRLAGPAVAAMLAAACTKYHPQPLSPEASAAAFGHRTLADSALTSFLATYDSTHSTAWDAQRLALTAWYFRPDLEVERERRLALIEQMWQSLFADRTIDEAQQAWLLARAPELLGLAPEDVERIRVG